MQVWVRINEGLKLSSSGQRAPSEIAVFSAQNQGVTGFNIWKE